MREYISRLAYDTLPQFPIGKRMITVIKKPFTSPTLTGVLAEACSCHVLGQLHKCVVLPRITIFST